MKIKFTDFILNEEEAAIRIPDSLEYWTKKGKRGKDCIIYTHDDLDGIFSAIALKEYLLAHGFKISGYAIINYVDAWKNFEIDKSYINICVDFAEDNADLDIYIDHHMDEDFKKKSDFSVKMKSYSCYYLICYIFGMPTDDLILSVISMIDSARYAEYDVPIQTILDLDIPEILKMKNPRLVFSGAFNQMIKRSDYKTLIEVIHNGNLSIYKIFILFKMLYPLNNISVKRGADKETIRQELIDGSDMDFYGDEIKSIPDFVPDSKDRLRKMTNRTVGSGVKPNIASLNEFKNLFWDDKKGRFSFDGFVVLNNLVYVPTGTWANPLRARALIEKTLDDDSNIQFILMDYGASLQIASYKNIEKTENLPELNDGTTLDNLDTYTRDLVKKVLPMEYGYRYDKAKGGGHKGIGNLSNIVGVCRNRPYQGIKIMDLMKNRIIEDITGIEWDPGLIWNLVPSEEREIEDKEINGKLMMIPQIRKVGRINYLGL